VEHRTLGRSDLRVSVVALGSWLTYGDAVDAEQARSCVRRALDLGVTLFDTANSYARGGAETALGDALVGIDRSSYVLATKVGLSMGAEGRGLAPAHVAAQCDASLRRLRTDHIDLYQCHRWDPRVPIADTMGALTQLVDAGKVRWLGFSEFGPAEIEAAFAVPDVARFVASQPEYSILCRRPVAEVFPLCRRLGVGHVVWSPLAQGVLTGKYRPGAPPPAGSRGEHADDVPIMPTYLRDDVLTAVQRLEPIAAGAGMTMAQLAVAWVLQEPTVASAIVGASRPEQLDATTAAAGVHLDAATMAAIDDAMGPVLERAAPRWRRVAGRVRRALPRG
jgi:1-deoxyxylulose-5-phosphate synthase